MSTSTKLSIICNTSDGTTTFSWKYVDSEAETTDIQGVATSLITNGAIFAKVPLSVKSITLSTTESTEVPLPA